MASVISFFILLLVTYSYSAPVGPEYGSSTTPYEYTTGQTTVEHVNSVSMNLMSDNESTVVPTIQKQRFSEESNITQVTTDYVTPSSPVYEKSSYPSSTVTYKKRDDKSSESAETESKEKRDVVTFPTSTKIYKKRDDKSSESAETESKEKRDVVTFPISTKIYKKRDDKSSESAETESKEKRDVVTFPTSTKVYKKRSDKDSTSAESESKEKRDVVTFPTSTKVYKKRDDKSSESAETESKEKRDVLTFPTSTKVYKKRTDDKLSESAESESKEKRCVGESCYPSSTETNKKRMVDNFLFTTLESSTEFNRRAIRPIESQEVLESSTVSSENEMMTDIKPSSSVDSFGKYTGLLKNKPIDKSIEESTVTLPIKTPQLIKTASVVPGEITETKVFTSVPSTSPIVIPEEQLSQGQGEPISKKRESNN